MQNRGVLSVFVDAQKCAIFPLCPVYNARSGKLTKEASNGLRRIFHIIDANHDGILDLVINKSQSSIINDDYNKGRDERIAAASFQHAFGRPRLPRHSRSGEEMLPEWHCQTRNIDRRLLLASGATLQESKTRSCLDNAQRYFLKFLFAFVNIF